MPLQKQETEIPLNGTMDVSSGAESQSVGTLRSVLDLRCGDDGEYEKRPATASTQDIVSPGDVGVYAGLGGAGLIESRGEVYAATDNYGVMTSAGAYVGSGGSLLALGAFPWPSVMVPKLARVSRMDIDRVSGGETDQGFHTYAACTYADATLVTAAVVYSSSTAASGCTLRLQAIDIATGAIIAAMQVDADGAGATSWAVDACENTHATTPGAFITFAHGNAAPYSLYVYRYDANAREFISDGPLGTALTSVRHRIITSPLTVGNFIIGYQQDATGLMVAREFAAGSFLATSTHNATHTGNGGVEFVVSGTKICILSAASGAGANVYAELYGTPADVITVMTTAATESVLSITGARQTAGGNTDHAVMFLSVFVTPATGPTYSTIYSDVINFTASPAVEISSQATSYNNMWAIGHGVTHDDRAYVLTSPSYDQAELPTPCWLRHEMPFITFSGVMRPVARVFDDVFATVGAPGVASNLASTMVVGDSIYAACLTALSADSMAGPGTRVGQVVSLSQVDLSSVPCTSAKKDGVALAATGLPFDIDGDVASIAQPYCRPVVSIDAASAGGTTVATSCYVVAVYTWIDAANRLHRSEPSLPVSTGTFVTQQLDVHVTELPYSPFTDTIAGRNYSIELYITADGGSTYYRANTASGKVHTSWGGSGGWRVFSDVQLGVAGNTPLYSTGSAAEELTSEATPAFHAICTVGDRMWAIDAEDRTRVWFTKPFAAGYAPEWNTVNTLFIGAQGVGISDLGGIPTVLAKDGIYQIYGDGPNSLGVGSFAPARKLPHEIECLDALSVCKTPAGILFRSRKGISMLGNDGSIQPVGHSIDNALLTSGVPTGYCRIVYDELSDEAHVLDFDQSHYVLSLDNGKWSKWSQDATFQNWRDAVAVSGQVYFLHGGASVTDSIKRCYAFDEADYNSHVAGASIETPWVRFDGVTGHMRIWEIVVQIRTGTAASGSTFGGDLTVTYETRTGESEVFTWTAAQIYTEAGGATDHTVNLRCRITNQKARQFKLTVAEAASAYAYSGHVPIAARVIYGVTPGGDRKRTTGQNKGSTAGG